VKDEAEERGEGCREEDWIMRKREIGRKRREKRGEKEGEIRGRQKKRKRKKEGKEGRKEHF